MNEDIETTLCVYRLSADDERREWRRKSRLSKRPTRRVAKKTCSDTDHARKRRNNIIAAMVLPMTAVARQPKSIGGDVAIIACDRQQTLTNAQAHDDDNNRKATRSRKKHTNTTKEHKPMQNGSCATFKVARQRSFCLFRCCLSRWSSHKRQTAQTHDEPVLASNETKQRQ